jgi:beta-lactam-binding protein with PASTA domain
VKKSLILSVSAWICIFGTFFFIFKIAERVYFNETYYYAPDFRGHLYEDIQKAMRGENINVKLVGEEFSRFPVGEIFLQEPEPGQVVKIHRNIRVWVSKGSALVEVPDFVGMNFLEARSIALQKGLEVDRVVSTVTNKAINEVLSTDPATDTLLRRGDKISFLISGTSNFTEVKAPNLIGLTLEEATEALLNQSLVVGRVSYVKQDDKFNNTVLEAGVLPGVTVRAGTAISLVVNRSKLERPPEAVSGASGDEDADGTMTDNSVNAAESQENPGN